MDISQVESIGTSARGKSELIKHLSGEKLTNRQMIISKCYDCMGFYADGRGQDCEIPDCPLYPMMPYGSKPREKSRRGGFKNKATLPQNDSVE